MIILTDNADKYRVGQYVASSGFEVSPTAPETTFIIYNSPFSKGDAERWLPLIPYRLVVQCSRKPSWSLEGVIMDFKEKKRIDYRRMSEALLRWDDRDRAFAILRETPIPLILSVLRENVKDGDFWRLIAKATFEVSNEMQVAAIVFGVKPSKKKVRYPEKREDCEPVVIDGLRESDEYTDLWISNDIDFANAVRAESPESLPKGVRKTKEKGVGWL